MAFFSFDRQVIIRMFNFCLMSLNNYMPHENRKRQKIIYTSRQKLYTRLGNVLIKLWKCTIQEQNKEKYKPFKTLCETQSKNFYSKVREVSLENTTIWKIKSLASSLNLCASNKLAQITVLEATKMKHKSSVTDWVHQNGATVKNVKRCQPV